MTDEKKTEQKKGFFARLIDSLDKKMEEKARSGGCGCCAPKSQGTEEKKCC